MILKIQEEGKVLRCFKCGRKGPIRNECGSAKKGQSPTKEEQLKVQTSVIAPTPDLLQTPQNGSQIHTLTILPSNKDPHSPNFDVHTGPQTSISKAPARRELELGHAQGD